MSWFQTIANTCKQFAGGVQSKLGQRNELGQQLKAELLRPVPKSELMQVVVWFAISAPVLVYVAVMLIVMPINWRVLFGGSESENNSVPAWRSVTYTETMAVKGQQQLVVSKIYLAEDGRARTELGAGGEIVSVTDKYGHAHITLSESTKTAHVTKAVETNSHRSIGSSQRWLDSIRKLCDAPTKNLGNKEVDGKSVDGYVGKLLDLEFEIWIEHSTRDFVRVDYDTTVSGSATHITLSDFQFDEKLEESLFNLDVPVGYKIYGRLPVSSESDNDEKRAAEAPRGMSRVWSKSGSWFLACGHQTSVVLFTIDRLGHVVAFDENGKKQCGFQIEGSSTAKCLNSTDLDGDGKPELVVPGNGGSTVKAYNDDGFALWTYSRGDLPGHDWAINDICVSDLNGDGRDEIIVSFNGSTGLHVLDCNGKVLWKNEILKNVWRVSAGRVDGYADFEIISTSAEGKLHAFNISGELLGVLDTGFYTNKIRIVTFAGPNQRSGAIIAAGNVADPATEMETQKLVSLDSKGQRNWDLELPAVVVSVTACPQQPWLAVTLEDGTARVINVVSGKEIACVGGQGGMTDAAWLPREKSAPLLAIANGTALNTFEIILEQ